MRCGNCKGDHEKVAEVRDCYAQSDYDEASAKAEAEMEARTERFFEEGTEAQHMQYQHEVEMDELNAQYHLMSAQLHEAMEPLNEKDEAAVAGSVLDKMTGGPGRDMASDRQVSYAMDLLATRDWPDRFTEQDVRNMERRQVSKLIDNLKAAPINVLTDEDFKVTGCPAGRYALEAGDDLKFYQVDTPTEGRWAGRTFVKQLFGAPGDFRKEPVRGRESKRVMAEIAKDPKEASLRFGRETRTCGVCHSPLTNEASRQLGIGPICVAKMGW